MTFAQWLLFMFLTLVSFLPVARLRVFNINKRYYYFKFLSIFVFIFSILHWMWYVSDNGVTVYYLTLFIYPVVFIMTALLFIAVLHYLKKKIPKGVYISLTLILIAELVLLFTNVNHKLLIDTVPNINDTYLNFVDVPHGVGFYIHTAICYSLLLIAIVLILGKLAKDFKEDKDIVPVVILGFGIVIGVFLNIYHVFIESLVIDPTYIAFVVLISMLYVAFYLRDIKVIFRLNSNNYIIHNLREMYVICNHRDVVVSASDEFLATFNISKEDDVKYSDILKKIEDKVVIYEDTESLSQDFDSSKRYLHMLKKEIRLPFFKQKGVFYLFYDETENQRYINDIAYVKSHDLMTKLYNRNYFEEIKEQIDESKQNYSLIMFDFDGLKFYNDNLGHNIGDELLIRFASIIKGVSDKYHLVPIRMGGDEFLVFSLNEDATIIEKVVKEIQALVISEEAPYRILFSYGSATKTNDSENVEKLISIADDEMYIMKQNQKSDKIKYQDSILCKVKK